MRLFVSVDLDANDELRTAQVPFETLDGVRLVDPEQVHITLKFLGSVDPNRLGTVETTLAESIAAADVSSFNAHAREYGVFPSHDYISVIWVGIRNDGGRLRLLHEAIEERMIEIGFEPADHAFTPHATIARMDHAGGKAHVQKILSERGPDLGRFEISEIHLTESTLTSDGPAYESVTAFEL
ncbi:RNA 2',3'-cyclic phosphodiesterase [Halocatena marina]|uniref:RNA 2',3'-cyclic phosphodiesterase n=1 Tax=Halocatena marina TaxID=2934937 RepID=UPI00200BCD4B|nr:RNA 2',3'-cyclic phosphodiesterase [Halocatena marina]